MLSSAFEDDPISSPPRSSPKDSCASKNIFKGANNIFQDLTVLKQLNKAKFPVYLVRSKVTNQIYAMKTFPYENNELHPYFRNEIRFCNLRHSNVIRNLYYEHQRKTITDRGVISKISYKIMEFAPFGDFYDFIMKNGHIIDEKLTRTYFKQLIEGLEYLHKRGVSHMDLKLENLLIGENYTLKIADFDLSQLASDTQVIGRGTKFYRAPEVMQGRCKDANSADIYSAGVVLFALKTQGILPHAEHNFVNSVHFFQLLHDNDPRFWAEHCQIQHKDQKFFDEDFKQLFLSMTCASVESRATISIIKKSKWYNGPCYTTEELKAIMERLPWCEGSSVY